MPTYNVYLGDVNSGLSDTQKNAVQSTILGWFGRIVPSGTTAAVTWITAAPASIQDNELLVHFVRDSMVSVVKVLPGGPGRAGDGDGFTAWGDMTASEVYVRQSRDYLAEMAFHELMHNKLHIGDAVLHSRNGLAHIPVSAGTAPSEQNITQMRAALNEARRQWTGAWIAASDPLFGI